MPNPALMPPGLRAHSQGDAHQATKPAWLNVFTRGEGLRLKGTREVTGGQQNGISNRLHARTHAHTHTHVLANN